MFTINRLRYMSFNFACSARTMKKYAKKEKTAVHSCMLVLELSTHKECTAVFCFC